MITITDAQVKSGAAAVRTLLNAAGYGWAVSDDQCTEVSKAVLEAALNNIVTPIPQNGN